MALSRDDILKALAEKRADVVKLEVPEWGGEVYVGRMSIGEAERIGLFNPATAQSAGAITKVLAACLRDEAGERLFGDDEVEQLKTGDFAAIVRIFKAVAEINGLDEGDTEAATESFAAAQPSVSSSS